MSTRKSMKLPIIITFVFIGIIIYLFTNIKQSVIVCEKKTTHTADIQLQERMEANTDGKKITGLLINKKVLLPTNYNKMTQTLKGIENALEYNLGYLGEKVEYTTLQNGVIATINIKNNELVLLDNISFEDNAGDLRIQINPNTKSSDVIALKVGDTITEGELMTRMKNRGYSCQ